MLVLTVVVPTRPPQEEEEEEEEEEDGRSHPADSLTKGQLQESCARDLLHPCVADELVARPRLRLAGLVAPSAKMWCLSLSWR